MGAGVVKEIYVEEKISSRTGRPYSNLVIRLESGYTFITFLSEEQRFALITSGVEQKSV